MPQDETSKNQSGEQSIPNSFETDGDQGSEGENPSQTPASPPPPTVSAQSEFSHEVLRGRSNEEIEAYVRTLEATNREYARRSQAPPAQQPPAGQPTASPTQSQISDKDFWDRPVEAITKIVGQMLDSTIQPFREDMARTQAASAWTSIAQEFSDFSTMRPMVEQLVSQHGIQAPTVDQLRSLYYLAKGYVASHPDVGGQPTPASPAPAAPRPSAPPQHPASSHPLPSQQSTPSIPELSELERRLAREMNPHLPPEQQAIEFKRWQGAGADQVLTMERKTNNG